MYRGSTGYSLNINKPVRTRPARGCDQQLEQPMFTTREMHKLKLVPLDLLVICILRSPIGAFPGTTSSNDFGGFDRQQKRT